MEKYTCDISGIEFETKITSNVPLNNSNWIDVNKKLPKHKQTILCYTLVGQSVCVFIDGKTMVSDIQGKFNHKIIPSDYYFCSQETPGATLSDVTHWMPLPDGPL